MRNLIADRPVLYGGRMYPAGAALPVCNLTEAWLAAETAHWEDDAPEIIPEPADKGVTETPERKPVRAGRNKV